MFKMKPIPFKGNYICGSFQVPPKHPDQRLKVSPADLKDQVMSFYFDPGVVEKACRIGKESFPLWHQTPQKKRWETLFKLKDVFQKKRKGIGCSNFQRNGQAPLGIP